MSRLMSVMHTEQAVVERRKTVTRRLGWRFLKPGDRLTLVRKSQGRKRRDGTVEPLVRLAEVEVVSVERGPLGHTWMGHPGDLDREGVPFEVWDRYRTHPSMAPEWAWIAWFAETMRCTLSTEVTRIEWRYLDGDTREDTA